MEYLGDWLQMFARQWIIGMVVMVVVIFGLLVYHVIVKASGHEVPWWP